METFNRAFDKLGTAPPEQEASECIKTITREIVNSTTLNDQDFSKYLALAVGALLHQYRHPNSDIRSLAEESLNKIVKSLMHSHGSRILVEIFKEIKTTASNEEGARSQRGALKMFAEVCHLVRPVKAPAFVTSLIPALQSMLSNNPSSVESLGETVPKIMRTLAFYFTVKDFGDVIRMFVPRLADDSAAGRRGASNVIVGLVRYSRKPPMQFVLGALYEIVDEQKPNEMDIADLTARAPMSPGTSQRVSCLLGVLTCCTHLTELSRDLAAQGETDVRDQMIPLVARLFAFAADCLVHTSHNVTTASMELLERLIFCFGHVPGMWAAGATPRQPVRALITRLRDTLEAGEGVRVGVKALALVTLARLAAHHADLFMETRPQLLVMMTAPPSAQPTLDPIRAFLGFSRFPDPLVRSNAALFFGSLIQGLLKPAAWVTIPTTPVIDIPGLAAYLVDGIKDESSRTRQVACEAVRGCLPLLLDSRYGACTLTLVAALLGMRDDPYWLAKAEVLDIFGSLNLGLLHLVERRAGGEKQHLDCLLSTATTTTRSTFLAFPRAQNIQAHVLEFVLAQLGDADVRVQDRAADALALLASNIQLHAISSVEHATRSTSLSPMWIPEPHSHELPPGVTHVMSALVAAGSAHASHAMQIGVIRAWRSLARLWTAKTATPNAFDVRPAPTPIAPHCSDVMGLILERLSSSWLATDLTGHVAALQMMEAMATCCGSVFELFATPVLAHCLRLLNLASYIQRDVVPEEPDYSEAQKIVPPDNNLSTFVHEPRYMKLYETLLNVFVSSTGSLGSDRFTDMIVATLNVIAAIVPIIGKEIARHAQELTACLSRYIFLHSVPVVRVVQQLFINIFDEGTPQAEVNRRDPGGPPLVGNSTKGLYGQAIVAPLGALETWLADKPLAPGAAARQGQPRAVPMAAPNSPSAAPEKRVIQFFEPLIPKMIPLYRNTQDAELMRAILLQFAAIVRIGVDYSRLDADNSFADEIIQQLSAVDSRLTQPFVVVPAAFEFLCALTFDRAVKSELLSPKRILQLATGLLSNGMFTPDVLLPTLWALIPHMCRSKGYGKAFIDVLLEHVGCEPTCELLCGVLQASKQTNQYRAVSEKILVALLQRMEGTWTRPPSSISRAAEPAASLIPILSSVAPAAQPVKPVALATNSRMLSSLHAVLDTISPDAAVLDAYVKTFLCVLNATDPAIWLPSAVVLIITLCSVPQATLFESVARVAGPPAETLASHLIRILTQGMAWAKAIGTDFAHLLVAQLCLGTARLVAGQRIPSPASAALSPLASIMQAMISTLTDTPTALAVQVSLAVLRRESRCNDGPRWLAACQLPTSSVASSIASNAVFLTLLSQAPSEVVAIVGEWANTDDFAARLLDLCTEIPVTAALPSLMPQVHERMLRVVSQRAEDAALHRLEDYMQAVAAVVAMPPSAPVAQTLLRYFVPCRYLPVRNAASTALIPYLNTVFPPQQSAGLLDVLSTQKAHPDATALLDALRSARIADEPLASVIGGILARSAPSGPPLQPHEIIHQRTRKRAQKPLRYLGDLVRTMDRAAFETLLGGDDFDLLWLEDCVDSGAYRTHPDLVAAKIGAAAEAFCAGEMFGLVAEWLAELNPNAPPPLPPARIDEDGNRSHDEIQFGYKGANPEFVARAAAKVSEALRNFDAHALRVMSSLGRAVIVLAEGLAGRVDSASLPTDVTLVNYATFFVAITAFRLQNATASTTEAVTPAEVTASLSCLRAVVDALTPREVPAASSVRGVWSDRKGRGATEPPISSKPGPELGMAVDALYTLYQVALQQQLSKTRDRVHVPPGKGRPGTSMSDDSEALPLESTVEGRLLSLTTATLLGRATVPLIATSPLPAPLLEKFGGAVLALARLDVGRIYASWLGRINPMVRELAPSSPRSPLSLHLDTLTSPSVLACFVELVTRLGFTTEQTLDDLWSLLYGVLHPQATDDPEREEDPECQVIALKALTILALQAASVVPGDPRSAIAHVPRRLEFPELGSPQAMSLAIASARIDEALRLFRRDGIVSQASTPVDAVFHVNLERTFSLAAYDSGQISVDMMNRQLKQRPTWPDMTARHRALLAALNRILAPNVNILLRKEGIKSILMISDFFTNVDAFTWMLTNFEKLYTACSPDDGLALQYLIEGLCKSCAVLKKGSAGVSKILKSVLEAKKVAIVQHGMHGLLYLIEARRDEVVVPLLPELFKYILTNIPSSRTSRLQMRFLAVLFSVIETYPKECDQQDFLNNSMTLIFKLFKNRETSPLVTGALMRGMQRLLLGRCLSPAHLQTISTMTIERVPPTAARAGLLSLGLTLASMYTSADALRPPSSPDQPTSPREVSAVSMERIAALFSRVRQGFQSEASVVASALPAVLVDFLPPAQCMALIMGEFLAQRPRPELVAGILFQLFEIQLRRGEHKSLAQWVHMSLQSFTQKTPKELAVWSITCVFLAASPTPLVRGLFPHLASHVVPDMEIFLIAGADFYRTAPLSDAERASFVATLSDEPFRGVLDYLRRSGVSLSSGDLIANVGPVSLLPLPTPTTPAPAPAAGTHNISSHTTPQKGRNLSATWDAPGMARVPSMASSMDLLSPIPAFAPPEDDLLSMSNSRGDYSTELEASFASPQQPTQPPGHTQAARLLELESRGDIEFSGQGQGPGTVALTPRRLLPLEDD